MPRGKMDKATVRAVPGGSLVTHALVQYRPKQMLCAFQTEDNSFLS